LRKAIRSVMSWRFRGFVGRVRTLSGSRFMTLLLR
jgi:hypothetical protein